MGLRTVRWLLLLVLLVTSWPVSALATPCPRPNRTQTHCHKPCCKVQPTQANCCAGHESGVGPHRAELTPAKVSTGCECRVAPAPSTTRVTSELTPLIATVEMALPSRPQFPTVHTVPLESAGYVAYDAGPPPEYALGPHDGRAPPRS